VAEPYPQPNDAQWEAIRATNDHLLVSASAGTGKTYTVVTKILFMLGVPVRGETHGSPINLDDIAAITFTNQAAAELKDKLRSALRQAGRRADAYKVDGARVGTIHSFCTSILREFSLRTGRSPSLHLVENAESILLKGETVRDALLLAVEDNLIAGMDALLAVHTVEKIQERATALLDQGDQLRVLIENAHRNPVAEQALLHLAKLASEMLAKRLDDADQVDFDRMISWTRDLIRDDEDVRRTLQRRIKVLFIDEFQDVDPAQREIAYLLAEPASGRTDTTRLVLVGDAKQSIYRFRNADVTVWRQVEADFTERKWGRVTPLSVNRRSVAQILGFVDATVGNMLDSPIDAAVGHQQFEIPYAAMSAHREDDLGRNAVEIVTIPPAEDGKARPVEEVRDIEAWALAERACQLHDEGTPWHEMAVLLCGWGAAEKYEAALRAREVPTYILRDEGFYSCLEITDVIIALSAIRNPFDDRVLFGFLRSPFVGLADESLLAIARAVESPFWPAVSELKLDDIRERALLERGVELLTQLGTLRDRISTAELIDTLLAESGYLAHLELLGREGQQRLANLRKLVRIADTMPEASVGDFLDMVAQQREVNTREGEAQLFGPKEDVVTITSVHSAKGLEWGVVFWCDLVRGVPNVDTDLLIGRETILMRDPTGDKSPEFDSLCEELKKEREAESKRLWYVAATRAKDLLVVSGIPLAKVPARSPAAEFVKFFPDLSGDSVEYVSASGVKYSASIRRAKELDLAAEPAAAIEPEPIGDPRVLSRPPVPAAAVFGRGRHSATELLSVNRCERRHWFRYVEGLREPPLRSTGSANQSNAIRRGLIVHDVLENYEEEVELGILVEAAIGRWDPDAPPPEVQPGVAYRKRVTEAAQTILSNSEYREVFDSPAARRELAFSYVRGAGEYLEGQIDLVAPGTEGYRIVDVKTSECDADVAELKANQYGPQRATYTQAVEQISGSPVASFAFQFAGAGAHISRDIGESDRASDEGLVNDLVQLIRSGAKELTLFPDECRFCGYKQEGWCPGAEGLVAQKA
jgi:ATP-dependent helicase/nuclease subunit A